MAGSDAQLYARLLKESPGTTPDIESRYYYDDSITNYNEKRFWSAIEYGQLERVEFSFQQFETEYMTRVHDRLNVWKERVSKARLMREEEALLSGIKQDGSAYEAFASLGLAQANKHFDIANERVQKARTAMKKIQEKNA